MTRLYLPWESLAPNALGLLLPAKSLQSCPTLCFSIDSSPPGFPVPGILQARTLEWVAISFSSAWKCKVKVKSLIRVLLLVTPWTAAYQAPPSMGFSRQEYWSGVPLPSPCSRALVLKVRAPGQQPSITWELRDADSQAPVETFWIRNSVGQKEQRRNPMF